jgi:hypothetical protein
MAACERLLNPGDKMLRKDVHQQYGESRQGGIGSRIPTPNVLIFSDPLVAREHGYFDDWGADGCYHYTGEGQHGDQEMKTWNAAILKQSSAGRSKRDGRAGSIRMALWQLLDYRRFVKQARCAILVPSKPRPDIAELVRSAERQNYSGRKTQDLKRRSSDPKTGHLAAQLPPTPSDPRRRSRCVAGKTTGGRIVSPTTIRLTGWGSI